jgi:hypothetical protein
MVPVMDGVGAIAELRPGNAECGNTFLRMKALVRVARGIFVVAVIWVPTAMPESDGAPPDELEAEVDLAPDAGPGDPLAARGH